MVCVGIDVAKDKHDCFILSSEGEVLADVFTIQNNAEGFDTLLQTIRCCARPEDKIKVGFEATGHYSYNILGFLLDKGLPTFVINPLHTNLYRKSLSLRKTKTDRVDARTIAAMLMSDVDLKSYTDTAYHNEELKSLTRYRFDKVCERAKLKQSVSRLVTILFPELEKLVPTLHMASVYALLSEFPGAKQVAGAHLTHLKAVLSDASKGRYTSIFTPSPLSTIQSCVVNQLCDRRMVISCGLHDHASLTVQAFEPPCQCAQFTIGVMDFKGRDDDLSEGAHDGNRASAFGNVDANRVHLHSSNL